MLYLVVIFAGSMTLTSGAMVLLRPPVEVETQDGKTSLDMPSDVMFAFDKAELESTAEPILARVASILKARKVREATIEGHTDGAGTPSYNQRLSERRASAVYEWLTTKGGMSAIRFHVIGYGATRPRAPNVKPNGADNPDGRLLNRRVEVSFAAGA